MKVGFIGLGTMGASMAANLQKSQYKLVVLDARKDAAAPHIERGAEWAATPKDVAAQCDVVFTSLPGPPEVEAVVFGPNGLLEGAHEGMAFFDLSTNSQAMARRINEALAKKGAFGFDAPVSGGPKGAASGKLAIWVGGDKPTFDKHKKVLDAIGDQAAYIGGIGSATVAKLVHNMAGYAIQTAMAEVMTMGVKAGMDPVDLWAAIRQGSLGRRRTFDRITEQFMPGEYDPPAFALKLAHKDVTLATSLGRELGVPMRFCQLVLEEMNEALNRGWGHRDSRVPMLLQVERAGVEMKADKARIAAVYANDNKA